MTLTECFAVSPLLLMEGALGERLKREYGLFTDGPVSMADLVYQGEGRRALGELWRQYMAIAGKHGLPFLATTPTRRAFRERTEKAGYDGRLLTDNMRFLLNIKKEAEDRGILMFAGGLMGCRGDAYTGQGCLDTEEAHALHRWQAGLLAEAGADFLYAALMPTLPESLGMALALAETRLPSIISFTIRRDGHLVDGTAIHDAIAALDRAAHPRPLCYMTNCVHPTLAFEALSRPFNRTALVRSRFLGIQANASPLPYRELDHSRELRQSSPDELVRGMAALREHFGFRIFGGCCGTDHMHLSAIADMLCPNSSGL